MNSQSILTDWKQNAERHDDRNFSFLRSLKNESDRKVDRAEYPYTDKPEISSRTHSIAAKTLECPAVFYIVEQMRGRGLR